jgi:hypothetical protein
MSSATDAESTATSPVFGPAEALLKAAVSRFTVVLPNHQGHDRPRSGGRTAPTVGVEPAPPVAPAVGGRFTSKRTRTSPTTIGRGAFLDG